MDALSRRNNAALLAIESFFPEYWDCPKLAITQSRTVKAKTLGSLGRQPGFASSFFTVVSRSMSKANQAHQFYSYTSPASDIQYTPSAPSAEDVNQPPSYDDAIRLRPGMLPETSNRKPFDGYVQDTSTTIPPFNPSSTAGAATFSSSSPSTNPYLQPNIPEFDEDFITAIPEEQQRLLSDDNDDQAFRGRPPPPGYAPYLAPYKTLKDGSIISRDEHLNRDGEALVQFLKQHNTPPNMAVRFRGKEISRPHFAIAILVILIIDLYRLSGWHEETFWRSRTSRDNDGNVIELQEPETRTITDFDFEIDCSDCISPFCQGIYVLPDKKTGEIKTVRQLCDDYVHEKNKLKELRLTKEIEWNYAELTRGNKISRAIHLQLGLNTYCC